MKSRRPPAHPPRPGARGRRPAAPGRIRRAARPDPTHVAAGVLLNDRDEVLLCQRRPAGRFGLKWEFPGGKVEPGETPRAALARELREELGIDCEPGRRLMRLEHRYDRGPEVLLEFFQVGGWRGSVSNLGFHDIRWVPRAGLAGYDILEADAPLVRRLALRRRRG